MDKNLTTNDQDKRFIRAMSKVAFELDRSIRGDKKAKKTRESAEKMANSGLDPDSDFNLDSVEGRSTIKKLVKKEVADPQSEKILKDLETLSTDISKKLEKRRKSED